jgi:hypothetical protein
MPKSETTSTKPPRPPEGAGTAGRRLWRAILGEHELAEHEVALLRQAVHVADVCEALRAVVDAEGLLTTSRLGEVKAHPALVELRAERLLLGRLVVALRVPLGDEDGGPARGQVRAIRGMYGPRSVS